MTPRILAIAAALYARPSTIQIDHVLKLLQPLALRAHKDQRIRHETDAIGFVQCKATRIDLRLVLVIQESCIETLLGKDLRRCPASHGSIMPILHELSQQFE